jgi:surface antigen
MAKSMEAEFRARIARKAIKEVGQRACSRKTAGRKGYFASCDSGFPGGPPQFWCADFARWVWWKAGAVNTGPKMGNRILTPESGSFAKYGKLRRKPRVGDAVLFNYNHNIHNPNADHVAIVVKVNPNGTIRSVSGDLNGQRGSDAHFAATSSVVHDNPYKSAIGSSDPQAPNSPVSGYVSPVEDDMPYTKKQITQMVKDGVAAELNTELGDSGITPAQGAKAAVQTHQDLEQLRQTVDALAAFVHTHLPGPPAPADGPTHQDLEQLRQTVDALAAFVHTHLPGPPAPADGPAPNSGTPGRRAGTRTATSPTT